jgi:ABC-2 type transport system ATP-binding protein
MGVEEKRVDDLLGLVGLERSAARKRVRQYSLGMRQRLGIANALIGEPEVLILDEPANGLDPEGMRWMRGLLRDFAERGGTVLLSSHLLHEIVAEGSKEELLSDAGTLVRADDGDALGRALAGAGLEAREAEGGGFLVDAEPRAVGAAAQGGGVALVHLAPAGDAGLEQLFFDLTTDDGNEVER